MWSFIARKCGKVITEQEIICGCDDKNMNFIICFIEFVIYKEWIVTRNEGMDRTQNFVTFLKSEIKYRQQIYKYINWYDYNESLQKILDML